MSGSERSDQQILMRTMTLFDYFEALTASVFQSGFSAQVVQAKWRGFERAFGGFDPEVVAEFIPEDVDRLVADESIIRNRRKIEAMVDNANRMLDIEREGGFAGWLASHGGTQAAADAIRREFLFLGASGAMTFLRMVSSVDNFEVCR